MKALTVIVLAVLAAASGYMIKVPDAPVFQPTLAPSGWIHLQKLVLPLFENVCEKSVDPIICRLSEEFVTTLTAGDFWDPEVITRFQTLKNGKGFLPKGQIFSEYNPEHTNELKIVLEVMRSAKNFDTFYKVAAWARQNLNCGLYVSLIYLALENRRDTEKLTLPPPYELLPNYFIRKDIIIQGSSLLAGEEFTPSEGVRDEGNAYTLDANYTANFYDNDDESKLAYFREDIGLNSFFFLRMLKWAPWLNDHVDINGRYGEEMYHMMKQLVARYNLERYSNGMPELDNLSWDSLSDAPYDPMLVYSNGNEFIHRTSPVQLPENEDKALLQTIESNIGTVVSHMRDAGYNKTQILNHLMEILVTGERSYDSLARHLLGKALSNNGEPTVFEHYMTSLRDPMIWRLYKKVVDLVDNALQILPPYMKSELYFPGVEVISIDVKKMMTNFDYFEFDITEALKIGNGDTTFQVKIGQPRLNHKPFMMKINISSLVTQKGLVKLYIGPKMMPGEFAKKKNMFSLLDSFEINLKKGANIVTKSSNDMKMFSPDFTSLKTLCKKVEDAQFGLDSLSLNTIDSQIGFPERLIIPKGTPEGLPLQLFVFVAPFIKASLGGAYSTPSMEFNSAVLSPLYPLDLAMQDRILLDLPNALVKDFMVTHKGVSKVSNYGEAGATKSWYDNSSGGPPTRPNAYANGNQPFDYNSKKGQYSQDDDTFNYQYYRSEDMNNNIGMQNDGALTRLQQQQPYDYKSTRPQYQKPEYGSKRIDYKTLYKNKSTETATNIVLEDETTEKLSEKPTDLLLNNIITEKVLSTENKDTFNNTGKKNINDIDKKKDLSTVESKYNLLKSSSPVFSSMTKESIDNKAKNPKFEKPDYKTMFKSFRKTTAKPVNIESKTKMPDQNLLNKDDDNEQIGDKVEIFKVIKDKNKIDSSTGVPANKYDKTVVKDVGNIDILKIIKDILNKDSSNVDRYDKVIIEDRDELNNGDYFGIFKDDGSEEILKVIPVTQSPNTKTNADSIYKYIIHNMDMKTDSIDTTSKEE